MRVFAAGKIVARQAQPVQVSPEAIGLFGDPHPKPGPDAAAAHRLRQQRTAGSAQPSQ